jgi:acetolactate synthase-1/2/3 large subunit
VVDLAALLRPRGCGRAADPSTRDVRIVDLSHGVSGSWSNAFAAPAPRDVWLRSDPLLGLRLLTEALTERVKPSATRGDAARSRASAARTRQRAAVAARWSDGVISPARLVGETWRAVREVDHLLCLRNTRTWPEGVWELRGAGAYLGHSGGGGVGYGPGALVGGALAARDRGQLGVGIIGDGDLLMASGALWTAAHYDIPALIVVNDNSSFYNDEPHQREMARDRGRPIENSWIGMRITDPPVDIAGLARAHGCWAERTVENPDDLGPALTRAVAAAQEGATAVVHAKVAPR